MMESSVKGSNYIETLSKVGHVVFDKTGTLTKGVFEVRAVHHNTMPKEELLFYAASSERVFRPTPSQRAS